MGRQAYLTRLALGRSAYEPMHNGESPATFERQTRPSTGHTTQQSDSYIQQFDDRGYPQNPRSRVISRRSRRAQNDVLATVGVLLGPDHVASDSGTPHGKEQRGPISVRNYEETAAESELGFWMTCAHHLVILYIHERMTYARQRMQAFRFYAGVPFHRALRTEWNSSGPLLFLLVGLPGDVLTLVFKLLERNLFGKAARRVLGDYLARKYLQTKSKDMKRLVRTGVAIVGFWLTSIATSPVVISYLFDTAHAVIRSKVFNYIRLTLPKPDNPDVDSLTVAGDRGEAVPGLEFTADGEYVTVQRLAEKDWTDFSNDFTSLISWCRSFIRGAQCSKSLQSVSHIPNEGLSAGILSGYTDSGHEAGPAEQENAAETALLRDTLDPSSPGPGFAQAEPVGEMNPRASESSSNDWQAIIEGSELELSPPRSRSKHNPPELSKPMYRVTHLTALMTETLATSLSTIIADILLLPLETLFVRSVALTYLSTAGGGAMGFRNEIYPLGSWFGAGIREGRAMDYARKMALCLGMDMLLEFGVWQVTAGVVWWVGTRRFRWGRL
ncbi:MAG: hypothetical protein Q9166_004059 [cf. Caloplaca sp. 2 TL-2023]